MLATLPYLIYVIACLLQNLPQTWSVEFYRGFAVPNLVGQSDKVHPDRNASLAITRTLLLSPSCVGLWYEPGRQRSAVIRRQLTKSGKSS